MEHLRKHLQPAVTIVICTCHRPALLRKCLTAISHLDPAPNEVIVVDNTAGDIETEFAAREFSARYIVEPTPGLSRARNRGLREGGSEIIAYLDDDAEADEHWLDSLLEPFDDPSVAVVTGDTRSPGSSTAGDLKPVRYLSNKNPQWLEIAAFGGLGVGANMALRKSACTTAEVFDERLGRGAPLHGYEEHHAFARLLSHGYSAAHVPAASVVHPSETRTSVEKEAAFMIAFWWLLFFEFPGHRFELVRFLLRRLRHKPVDWTRNAPDTGRIITSEWRVRFKAGLSGTLLYFRSRKWKAKS